MTTLSTRNNSASRKFGLTSHCGSSYSAKLALDFSTEGLILTDISPSVSFYACEIFVRDLSRSFCNDVLYYPASYLDARLDLDGYGTYFHTTSRNRNILYIRSII